MKNKIKPHLWDPMYNEKDNYYYRVYNESIEKTSCQQHETFQKKLRFYSLLQLTHHAIKTNPNYHFVECGCFKGQSTYGISKILKDYKFKNKFYVFDSFEGGLSNFQNQDKTDLNTNISLEEQERRKNQYKSNEQDVKNSLKEFNFVEFYKGWIPNKFQSVKDLKFQFVHIDVDLYQPTYDSLEFFYSRLVPGGIIICDDYNFTDFPGAKAAWDEYFNNINNAPAFRYEVPLGSVFAIK